MVKDVTAFERVMWPAMAERVRVMLESPAGRIRGGDRLEGDVRAQIEAATPRQAMVTAERGRASCWSPTSRCIPDTAPFRTATTCWSGWRSTPVRSSRRSATTSTS